MQAVGPAGAHSAKKKRRGNNYMGKMHKTINYK